MSAQPRICMAGHSLRLLAELTLLSGFRSTVRLPRWMKGKKKHGWTWSGAPSSTLQLSCLLRGGIGVCNKSNSYLHLTQKINQRELCKNQHPKSRQKSTQKSSLLTIDPPLEPPISSQVLLCEMYSDTPRPPMISFDMKQSRNQQHTRQISKESKEIRRYHGEMKQCLKSRNHCWHEIMEIASGKPIQRSCGFEIFAEILHLESLSIRTKKR